jgi:hypothetical protein
MTTPFLTDTHLPSRGAMRPSCAGNLLPSRTEGVGNAGCPMHPQPPVQQKSTGVEATGPPDSPGIPARNGFNGFLRALPGDRAWLSPSPGAVYCAELERQRRGVRTTRLRRPLGCRSSATPPRPPHPAPTSVTTAKRPSCGTGWRKYGFDLGWRRREIFFRRGLDSPSEAGSSKNDH